MVRPVGRGARRIEIVTERYGRIAVAEEDILSFPRGLAGHRGVRRWALIAVREYVPFLVLVAVDDPRISLPVVNPRTFLADYDPPIPAGGLPLLGNPRRPERELLSIVTFERADGRARVDLRRPIVVNVRGRVALQIEYPSAPEGLSMVRAEMARALTFRSIASPHPLR